MYSKQIPYKDFKDKARNETVYFNLTVPEIMRLLEQFQVVFRHQRKADEPVRELETEEVMAFYDAFETILLDAYGVPSEDGKYFRKDGKYDFKESALFPAAMMYFATDPQEAIKLLNGIVPSDMADLIQRAETNLKNIENAPETPEQLKAEIARLQAQLPATDAAGSASSI